MVPLLKELFVFSTRIARKIEMNDLQFIESNASFSPDRDYRFALWRIWDDRPKVMFVGLNPSTASESLNDPTIRRCIGFAKDWGYGGVYMCNLFGLVSTDPKALYEHLDPVGRGNNLVLQMIRDRCRLAVAAWGALVNTRDFKYYYTQHRAEIVAEWLAPMMCLGITKNNCPRHPLYLSKDTKLQEYK